MKLKIYHIKFIGYSKSNAEQLVAPDAHIGKEDLE